MLRLLTGFLAIAAINVLGAADRPNIIWIVGEDMGPELGCYGDAQAITPNIDRLARQGARFARCFTHAPVCAPSRSGLITGRYPTTIGSHHMRSKLVNPPRTFTSHLREAGYFVAWPGKTDFNFNEPADFADTRGNWLQNAPPREPFFAYINFNQSHESQVRNDGNKFAANIRRLTEEQRHDPAKMRLPPYHPDAPEVRADLARYYDLVTSVDYDVGAVLAWIDKHQLAENTVVFFFGDHGRGLARSKRWVYDSGTHVPLIVRWPGKIEAGSLREDLVAFVDLPATVLALGGIARPVEFQGQVFLGPEAPPPRKYVFAHRDFMDETYDRIRSVRDARFRYIRNFRPELPYAQPIEYMDRGPTMKVWRRWNDEGKLRGAQRLFFLPTKPGEELYDTAADPHEIVNLANDPQHAGKLNELRDALERWMSESGDLGDLSVEELVKRGIIKERDPIYGERRARAAAAQK